MQLIQIIYPNFILNQQYCLVHLNYIHQVFIGVLIETQPIYIKGLHKRRARARMNYIDTYQMAIKESKTSSVSNENRRRLSQFHFPHLSSFTQLSQLSQLPQLSEVTEMYGSVRRRLENAQVFVESANA